MDQGDPPLGVDGQQSVSVTSNISTIGRATSIEDIISALAERGCVDLTGVIDLAACGHLAVAGGGFCDVYRGQLKDGKTIAIKSLRVFDGPEADSQRESILKHAAKELYQWSRLQHSNVLPLLGLARFHGRISMVSEWMANGSLRSFIRLHPEARRIPFCVDICAGLRHIHENGMVHGDLKAENVMVSANEVAMITDFGSSQLKDSTLKFSKTAGPAVTLRWAAPELFRYDDGCQVSTKTDIYAYGMTVLEALTGKVPFEDLSDYQIYAWVVNQGKHPPRPNIDLDESLWDILESCWDQIPARRPSSARISARLQEIYPNRNPWFREPIGDSPHATSTQKDSAVHSKAQTPSSDGRFKTPSELENIGTSCMARFERHGELADLDAAIYNLCQAVVFAPAGDLANPSRLSNLGHSYKCRFKCFREISDVNLAIGCLSHALQLAADGSAGQADLLYDLGTSYRYRFEVLGELADIDKAIEFQARAVALTTDDQSLKPSRLCNLGAAYTCRFKRLRILTDIEKAIEFQKTGLKLTPYGHEGKPRNLNKLGKSYTHRFDHLGELEDLNRATEYYNKAALLLPATNPTKSNFLKDLGESYMRRYQRFGDLSDVESAIEYFKQAANSPAGSLRVHFEAASQWASLSPLLEISPELAYHNAMGLLPELTWLGATVDQRYQLLDGVGDFVANAVSWAISNNIYDLALEWLEQGRFIVWNQILQLRAPLDGLASIDPELARRLADVGRELQQVSSQPAVGTAYKLPTSELLEIEQETQSRHQLATEWQRLLKAAREIPAFEEQLRARKANRLMLSAKNGPVVVINVSQSRCDALVITPKTSSIAHIELDTFSIEKVVHAHDTLMSVIGDRGRLVVHVHQELFKNMLPVVWLDVVKPVLDFLGYRRKLPVDELPHITWCPTGVLSFLPLHAAGCYDGLHLGALDLVVSSYTPTLSALLSPPVPSQNPSLLVVGQGGAMGRASLPGTASELAAIKNLVGELPHLQLEGEAATVEAVLSGMENYNWLHMACHASQNTKNPILSAFHLHDNDLTLSRIAQQPFTPKGLAFLSACHTVIGHRRLPDEMIHLAAGMFMSGYSSVIATMWGIRDADGPGVARDVYTELLKEKRLDSNSAARALHKAVVALRDKVGEGEFDRWAPFVHIGS